MPARRLSSNTLDECSFLAWNHMPSRNRQRRSRSSPPRRTETPITIKLIAGILIIVDETDEKAQAKYEEYLSYADLERSLTLFGGWTGLDLDKWGDGENFKFTGLRANPEHVFELVGDYTCK